MKKVIFGFLASIGALFVALLVGMFFLIRPTLPTDLKDKPIALLLDFSRGLNENGGQATPLLSAPSNSLFEIVRALDLATKDPQVKGVVSNLSHLGASIPQAQEIRNMLIHFRANGNAQSKFTYAFADTFGELSGGMTPYFLATAFDHIWLQPVGLLASTGLAFEMPFAKDALDKIDVKFETFNKGEYKSSYEFATESDFTPASREELQAVLSSLSNLMIRDIAVARELTEIEVKEAVDNAPLLGHEAIKSGLVDKLGYWDQMLKLIQVKHEKDIIYLTPEQYLNYKSPSVFKRGQPKVAVIFATGMLMRSSAPNMFDVSPADANRISKAIQAATKDPDVKAIILRINSPGGAPVAAETIHHAIKEAQKKKIPVVATMSTLAASGGYWVACACDKVVAHSATLTGSIGVLLGKPITEEFWDNLGIKWRSLSEGKNATLWSSNKPTSDRGRAKIQKISDYTYENFLDRVMQGRKLERDHVEQIAKGRVWVGESALKYGLVDQLGGFDTAIDVAKRLAGLQDQEITLQVFPRQLNLIEKIYQMLLNTDPDDSFAEVAASIVSEIRVQIMTFVKGSLQTSVFPGAWEVREQ